MHYRYTVHLYTLDTSSRLRAIGHQAINVKASYAVEVNLNLLWVPINKHTPSLELRSRTSRLRAIGHQAIGVQSFSCFRSQSQSVVGPYKQTYNKARVALTQEVEL